MGTMRKAPTISVIIPVYNQEKYAGKCLRSVLEQEFSDIEVIVVNDGSTDGSLLICKKFAGEDVRVTVIDKPNEGQTLARRDGLLKARGEYVCFVDSDDYLESNALETLISATENRQIDLVIGNYDRVYDKWGLVRSKPAKWHGCEHIIERPEYQEMMLGFQGLHQNASAVYMWGRLYRLQCVLKAMGERGDLMFPKTLSGEDLFFNLAVMPYINSMKMTNKVVYHYRYGGVSSHYLPVLRDGTLYFDTRYDYCLEFHCQHCLPSFFYHYLSFLYMEIRMQIHYNVDTEEGIRRYVEKEINDRKIVRWAQENIKDNNEKAMAVAQGNVDLIMYYALRDERKLRKHYLVKKCILWCQKVF